MPTEKIGTTRNNDNTATERNLSFIIVMGLAVNFRKNSRIDLCLWSGWNEIGQCYDENSNHQLHRLLYFLCGLLRICDVYCSGCTGTRKQMLSSG